MKDLLKEVLHIIKKEQNKNINSHISEFIKKYNVSPICKKKLNLTDKQKTAIIIVSMPPEISVQVMREFSQEEVQEIASEIARLPNVTPDTRNAVIEELLDNSLDLEKNNWSYLINNRFLSDYTAGDYRISFNPQEKKIRVTIAKEWTLNLAFTDGNEFLFHLISPQNKLLYSKNKMEKEYIIKFTCSFYSAVFAVFKEKLFFMIFDIRKFNIEKELLLIYSPYDLRLYMNRELMRVNSEQKILKEKETNFVYEDEDYDDYVEDNDDDSAMWIDRGIFLYKTGDYEGAIKCCDKALEIDPADTFAMTKKGAILCSRRKFEEALKYFDRVLEIDSDDDYAMLCKVSALIQINRYDEAIFYCNRLLAKQPDNTEIKVIKAKCLFIKGRYEETLLLCNEALAGNPEEIRFSLIKSICEEEKWKKHTEEENKKYMDGVDKKYMESVDKKIMEEKRREYQKEKEEHLKNICRECGVSPEKGAKIHYVCRECSLPPDEAKIFLEENENDERKTVRNIRKQEGLEDKIIYVCRRTKVSEEEAEKALDEYDYDEIEAVMGIKKERRKKRGNVEDNQENKRIEKNCTECNKKLERIISILKNNLRYVSLFLFSIKSKFVREKNIEI